MENNKQSIQLDEKELIQAVRQAVVEERSHEAIIIQHPSGARCELASGSKTLKQLITIGFNSIERLNKSSETKTKMPGIQ